jgi:pectin methylesterase-like acyl-CoA thioesterase
MFDAKVRILIALATAALLASCASTQATTDGTETTAATGSSRNLVTASELATAGDVNLYEALTRIRPTILRSRIGGGTTGVQASALTVYLDGLRMNEGIEHLRSIGAQTVQEVRLLEPQQANARFGGNNSGGALVVTTKK